MQYDWKQIDSCVREFERRRSVAEVDNLSAFAPTGQPELRRIVLAELIRIDLEMGWQSGRPRAIDYYASKYPDAFIDRSLANDIAFEEFRLRCLAGQKPRMSDYRNRGFDISNWPTKSEVMRADDRRAGLWARLKRFFGSKSNSIDDVVGSKDMSTELEGWDANLPVPEGSTVIWPRVIHPEGFGPSLDLLHLLHRRLRYIAIGCAAILGYFSMLLILHPQQKVAFSLQNWLLIFLHWIAFIAACVIAVLLWSQKKYRLKTLRGIELLLFATMLGKIAIDLFYDLFVDRELYDSFTQGEHALFHYGSSWSLPFVILIVCYGTLIPSSWRRCRWVVTLMALVPLSIVSVYALWDRHLTQTFFQSFMLQIIIWIAAAVGIAVFGASRIEELSEKLSEARRLGQYRLQRRIGAGGMGEVYLAEHILLRRPCAIKLMRQELASDPAALARFEHEVQVTATLTHPNTVQIYDYGYTSDQTFYYVMEYLDGLNLEQLVRQSGPMSPDRVVHIVDQICGALIEAHEAGLIHRDIKPSNIIIGNRGGCADVAKLLDFGLVLGDFQLALPLRIGIERVAGSPLYMSPEQAAGRQDLDCRVDIYGLGAVMYFLLAGRPPFIRPTLADTLQAQVDESPIPLASLRSDISTVLANIISRCMEKKASERYDTVRTLRNALAEVSASHAVNGH